jgi:iron complex transport system permease protein
MRTAWVSAGLTVALVVMFATTLSVGDFPVPLGDVVRSLLGSGTSDVDFVVRSLRLPRALNAVLVGSAFGLSGAVFQSLARNPLASPDIVGITAGASAAAVAIIVLIGASTSVVSLGALAGALLTAVIIYVLSYRRGLSSYRLVLVGIGISAVLVAGTSFLLTRAQTFDAQRAMVWLTGSLNGRGWEQVHVLSLGLAVLLPLLWLLARPLRILLLGDDVARGLGLRVERSRLALVAVAVALAAAATAASGPVDFVALAAPPMARRLTRAPVALLPAALAGALLVLASDLVSRRAFAPTELPVGVVTGLMGAPYLMWLLVRANRRGG